MLSPESALYLLVPNEANERVLHPGKVIEGSGEEFAVQFERAIAPPPGTDVNVFFERGGKFMQLGASIVALREAPAPPFDPDAAADPNAATIIPTTAQAVVFKPMGQPVSAESRGSYRVSVVTLDMLAKIDKERNCQLVDISPEGFGAYTKTNHRLGLVLEVSMNYEGEALAGRVRVQTVRQISPTRFRCGFLAPSTEMTLRGTLQRLTAMVQRTQIRRLKRTA